MHEVGTETDYYSILGIDRDAGVDTVRESYRRLMQHSRNHPDLGGDTQTAALINKAYKVLSNSELRTEYDARLLILERVAQGFAPEDPRSNVHQMKSCVFCGQPHNYSEHDDLSDIGCARCGSALQAAGSDRMEYMGQRAVQRFGKAFDMMMFTGFPQEKGIWARSEDLSLHGLRLCTRSSLQMGQRVRLISGIFDAVGDVVHCGNDNRGWRSMTTAGVAFLTLRLKRQEGVFVSRQI